MNTVIICIYILILVAIALIDARTKLIPNKIVVPSIMLALLLSLGYYYPNGITMLYLPWPAKFDGLFGGLAGFFLLFLPTLGRKKFIGAGDIKLAALIGLMVGFPLIAMAIFIAVFTSAIFTTILLALKRINRRDSIPFGPFLFVGGTITLIFGVGFLNWYLNFF